MRPILLLIVVGTVVLLFSCRGEFREKPILLKADREAPLGWVYLTVYQDSTFEFVLSGLCRSCSDVYSGTVEIREDSLFFLYSDSIPRAGKTAIFNDKVIAYIDGEYPERLSVSHPLK